MLRHSRSSAVHSSASSSWGFGVRGGVAPAPAGHPSTTAPAPSQPWLATRPMRAPPPQQRHPDARPVYLTKPPPLHPRGATPCTLPAPTGATVGGRSNGRRQVAGENGCVRVSGEAHSQVAEHRRQRVEPSTGVPRVVRGVRGAVRARLLRHRPSRRALRSAGQG
eukprot:scaffold67235_cov61-Phaeocystis_antarctica.AAC.3